MIRFVQIDSHITFEAVDAIIGNALSNLCTFKDVKGAWLEMSDQEISMLHKAMEGEGYLNINYADYVEKHGNNFILIGDDKVYIDDFGTYLENMDAKRSDYVRKQTTTSTKGGLSERQKSAIRKMVEADWEVGHTENDYDECYSLMVDEGRFKGVEDEAVNYYFEVLENHDW